MLPSRRRVAVRPARGVESFLLKGDTVPDAGSYTSMVSSEFLPSEVPPAISTLPSCNATAAWFILGEESWPATGVNRLVDASNRSSEELATPFELPPAISTFPLPRETAAAPERESDIGEMVVHFPVDGSKISAAFRDAPPDVEPPATSTRPSGSAAQAWLARG